MGQVAELRVIKEQLKQKQEVLEAEMEAFRREKEARAEEVTFDLLSSKKNHALYFSSLA